MTLPQNSTVLGLGVDIVEVDRIEQACARHGERFINRIFTEDERAYCMGMKNPWPHFAARFAAKEAASKAFATGIGAEFGWTSVSICKGDQGQPLAQFSESAYSLLSKMGASDLLLSLSHTRKLAIAAAILIR